MGPTRKSRSVNKRYSDIPEVSPSKDGDSSKKSNSRKRKLSDMLGPRWTMEELTRFYDSYRKHSKDWKKVAGAVRNHSAEMVEALYTMNRAYLSLPHGTASAAGLIAMMTDHYSNLAVSDSDQENNDGAGSSQKTQKRARGKVQPPTPKVPDEYIASESPITASNYGCLSLLKKKRSGGSRPRPVGKRTPRFPVSFSYENINGEKFFSPTRQGLKLKSNADDDEVAHEIAIALAEASQRGGSPQVSGTLNRRAESVMSSPFRHAQRKPNIAEISNAKQLATDTDEEDLEGSTEADTGELSRYKPHLIGSVSIGTTRQKGKKLEGRKHEVDNNIESHLGDIKEECSGTEEGQQLLSAMRRKFDVEVNDTKVSRSPMQNKKKSKKVLFGRDEGPAFDALQTLADLSLMMPTDNEDDSVVLFKDEHHDHVDESVPLESPPANQPREKRRPSGVRTKGHLASSLEVASSKTSKPGKGSVFYGGSVHEEYQDSHQSTTKARKKQKTPVSKSQKPETHADVHLSGSPGIEVGDVGKKLMRSKKSSQSSSPRVMKISENSSGTDLQKEGSDSAQSATQVTVNNLPTKMLSRRKMNLKKPLAKKDLKLSEKISNDENNLSLGLLHDTVPRFKNLSNCLSNQRLRRWCTYEWFYSAIDYPWFAKREFVEYLYHVGLGHVPRLTRVEWGVIRSSLGKPRRFSEQFLKEEKDKLNQYRESVRKHYTELREGLRDGLPTDLARPLSVGQRVIAIHPKTREIHDGSVLTVDHLKCRVQFDRQELGVEFVMDIDCMPVNPFEIMPAILGRHTITVDKFFESFNELKENGRAKEYIKLSPNTNLDNMDDIFRLSLLANPASFLKQSKVASDVSTRPGTGDTATYQQTYPQPGTLAQIQAKETDIQALAQLTRALDKKEAIVLELRRMNDDVVQSRKDGDSPLKESEPFKKQYAAVLIQLNEANEQVSSALHRLRERNTYQGKLSLAWPRPLLGLADLDSTFNSFDRSAFQTQELGSHVNEIVDSSRTKAQTMVDAALQAISSLKNMEDTMEKIEEAIDYVNDRLPSDDSCIPVLLQRTDPKSTNASDIETQIPSELITKCVATLLMIQKCTERQFPPSDVAQILDSAVTSLQPRSSQNLPVYTEIQKCVGIIKNQILALIPT
ncbi:protein ALWAYS EARLY 3-like isoform X2 [Salvia splendens]|uniref:protein ALWAYS EARLY 3-like isoform X2 n=1 Tax=Salvia splendens TaxID=180675 RepID=UPI001C27AD1F|nr:protein ALWAYS EARLY 3-like isoform X2 [Salvia splendens]